jgi:hypothetical protein
MWRPHRFPAGWGLSAPLVRTDLAHSCQRNPKLSAEPLVASAVFFMPVPERLHGLIGDRRVMVPFPDPAAVLVDSDHDTRMVVLIQHVS